LVDEWKHTFTDLGLLKKKRKEKTFPWLPPPCPWAVGENGPGRKNSTRPLSLGLGLGEYRRWVSHWRGSTILHLSNFSLHKLFVNKRINNIYVVSYKNVNGKWDNNRIPLLF
jgi:hypothetical protein